MKVAIVAAMVLAAAVFLFAPRQAESDDVETILLNIKTTCNHGNRVYAASGFGNTITIAVVKGCE